MKKFQGMELEAKESAIEILDSDHEDPPLQETTPQKPGVEKGAKPLTVTPPKVASLQSKRRLSFPKLNIKKLRLMVCPEGLQIGGRFFSRAKRVEIEEDLHETPQLRLEQESEESDGSWDGPPLPGLPPLDATGQFALVPYQEEKLPAPVLPQDGEAGKSGASEREAWGL